MHRLLVTNKGLSAVSSIHNCQGQLKTTQSVSVVAISIPVGPLCQYVYSKVHSVHCPRYRLKTTASCSTSCRTKLELIWPRKQWVPRPLFSKISRSDLQAAHLRLVPE